MAFPATGAWLAALPAPDPTFDRLCETNDTESPHAPDTLDLLFTCGGCGLYAAALVDAHPDWEIRGHGQAVCAFGPDACASYGDDLCNCRVEHFYAYDPVSGWCYDVRGEHDPAGLTQDPQFTLTAVSDASLAGVLETWYGHDRAEAATMVALARLHLVGPDPPLPTG